MDALIWLILLLFTFVVLSGEIKKKRYGKKNNVNSKMANIIRSRKKMLFLDERVSKDAIDTLNEIAKEDYKNKNNNK